MLWLKRLIIFLVRKYMGVGKWDDFYFVNQRVKDDRYYFNDTCLMKYCSSTKTLRRAHVSLNHLLSSDCEIVIVDEEDDLIEKALDNLKTGG